jgi:hypothetical protein
MQLQAYKHARLMEESEWRVERATYSRAPADMIASRVFDTRGTYRRWALEHDRLMRGVSSKERLGNQVTALRATAFSLLHKRALFEYLRDRSLTGAKRHRLFALFYGCRDYTNAVLAEHGTYVRCSSSYLCTHHIADELMHDSAFDEPLQLYEQFHGEYFRAYCDVELAESTQEREELQALEALRPLLKYRLSEARQAILAMPLAPEQDWREVQIRKPNGDTQRMRAIFG